MEATLSRVPIYKQLSHKIREDILSGKLSPGDCLPSEKEFERIYNVSSTTVKQALAELARDNLVARKQGKGTFILANRLSSKVFFFQLHNILAMPYHPYASELMASLQNEIKEKMGADLAGVGYNDQTGLLTDFVSDLDKKEILNGKAAILDRGFLEEMAQGKREMMSFDFPAVGLSARTDEKIVGNISVVKTPWRNLVCDLASKAVERGHGEIALIYSKAPYCYKEGFEAAVGKGYLAEKPLLDKICDLAIGPQQEGYRAVKELYASGAKPEAIVITDDFVVKGALIALLEMGIRIGSDVELFIIANKATHFFVPFPHIRLELDPAVLAEVIVQELLCRLEGSPPRVSDWPYSIFDSQ